MKDYSLSLENSALTVDCVKVLQVSNFKDLKGGDWVGRNIGLRGTFWILNTFSLGNLWCRPFRNPDSFSEHSDNIKGL